MEKFTIDFLANTMAGVENRLRDKYEKFSYDRHLTGFNLGRARVSPVSDVVWFRHTVRLKVGNAFQSRNKPKYCNPEVALSGVEGGASPGEKWGKTGESRKDGRAVSTESNRWVRGRFDKPGGLHNFSRAL